MKKILLDTNCYTAFLAGDEKVLAGLATAEIVFMSIFVLGELFAGFKGGRKEDTNQQMLEKFLTKPTVQVLDATSETAQFFGLVKDGLKKTGSPIPINDVWIAAHTLETGSTLVTYDAHFSKVAGLRLWTAVPLS